MKNYNLTTLIKLSLSLITILICLLSIYFLINFQVKVYNSTKSFNWLYLSLIITFILYIIWRVNRFWNDMKSK